MPLVSFPQTSGIWWCTFEQQWVAINDTPTSSFKPSSICRKTYENEPSNAAGVYPSLTWKTRPVRPSLLNKLLAITIHQSIQSSLSAWSEQSHASEFRLKTKSLRLGLILETSEEKIRPKNITAQNGCLLRAFSPEANVWDLNYI